MRTVKATTSDVASILTNMGAQIQSPVLSKIDRRKLRNRNDVAPDQLIEMICHLAEQNGGTILGMPFDAATARATLVQTSATRTQIAVTRQLAQRMEDDMIQQRIGVADPAFAIYTALRRLVNTKSGNSLALAYAKMKTIVKNRPRKPRAKKGAAGAVAKPVVPTTTAPAAAVAEPPTAAPVPPTHAPAATQTGASTSN